MPDGTVAPPDAPKPPPQFKVAETLHYGGETTVSGLSPEMQKFKNRAARLRKEEANNPNDGKKFLEDRKNNIGEKNLTKQNREDLDLRFGVGEVKKNSTTGKIEAPATFLSPEAKALYDEAQAEIKNLNSILQYSEIAAETKKTGKPITAILTERAANGIDGPKTQAEFDAQREKVLDYIINTGVMREGVPELATITNLADRRKLIEETLAADPALRAKITEKMVSIAERAKDLPEPPTSKEVKDAEDNKKGAEAKVVENLDLIRDSLKDLGIDDARAEVLKKDTEKYLRDGKSLDQVLGYLRSEALGQLKNIPAMQEYSKAINLAEAMQKRLDSFDVSRTVPAVIADAQNKLSAAQSVIDRFENNPDLVAELDRYNEIIRAFNNQKDNSSSVTEGGVYLSPVAHEIDQITRAQKAILTADKTIREKGELSKMEQEAWRVKRLATESGLVSEMKNAVDSSIAEVLGDRYNKMVMLEQKRMAEATAKEEKKGNQAIADGNKKVEEAKAKNWIEDNKITRKRDVHRVQLGSDGKYAIYAGDEGIKRLIGRDSGIVLKDAAGNPMDWKDVNLDTLPENIKKTLDGIYNIQKDSYTQKLFGDFFLAQSSRDGTLFGKPRGELGLSENEQRLFNQNFSGIFEKSINSKAEAKEATKKIDASGIRKSGGLLSLLALLFATPTSVLDSLKS